MYLISLRTAVNLYFMPEFGLAVTWFYNLCRNDGTLSELLKTWVTSCFCLLKLFVQRHAKSLVSDQFVCLASVLTK